MDYFYLKLIFISALSLGLWVLFVFKTRNAQFMSPGKPGQWDDNAMMVYAAGQSSRWRWPSDMHINGIRYTHMKDWTILMLAIFQKILRNTKTPFPLITAYSFSVALSAILIFFIGSSYWSSNVGLFISLLYILCLWPWQLSLFGGHLNIATMFLLGAVLCTTQSIGSSSFYYWLLASGFLFGCSLFASASSHRYIMLFFSAVFYAEFSKVTIQNPLEALYSAIIQNYSPLVLWGLGLFILALATLKLSYEKIVTAMYNNRLPTVLNKISDAGRNKYPLETYLKRAGVSVNLIIKWGLVLSIFSLALITFIGIPYLIATFAGLAAIFLILTLPNIPKNFSYYLEYVKGAYVTMDTAFVNPMIIDLINKITKRKIHFSKRGGGLKWTIKLYFRMIPLHIILYLALLLYLVTLTLLDGLTVWPKLLLIASVSLSPVIYGELTSAVQLSRSYASGLIGFILLIGYGTYILSEWSGNFWYWAIPLLTIVSAWNIWKFIDDVFPARMATANLIKMLDKLNIKEFYTYKTNYNTHLIYALSDEYKKKFTIHYIDNLNQVGNGWVVIPPTSSKSPLADAEVFTGDFKEDGVLNKLLEIREIQKIAKAKFKTWGTSTIWPHDGEFASFRDLILNDVTKKDRFRGYAWLLYWPA